MSFFTLDGIPPLEAPDSTAPDDARSDITASSGSQHPEEDLRKLMEAKRQNVERSRDLREALARKFLIRPIPAIETLEESDTQVDSYSKILKAGWTDPRSVLARAYFKKLAELKDANDMLLKEMAIQGDLEGGTLISPQRVRELLRQPKIHGAPLGATTNLSTERC